MKAPDPNGNQRMVAPVRAWPRRRHIRFTCGDTRGLRNKKERPDLQIELSSDLLPH